MGSLDDRRTVLSVAMLDRPFGFWLSWRRFGFSKKASLRHPRGRSKIPAIQACRVSPQSKSSKDTKPKHGLSKLHFESLLGLRMLVRCKVGFARPETGAGWSDLPSPTAHPAPPSVAIRMQSAFRVKGR